MRPTNLNYLSTNHYSNYLLFDYHIHTHFSDGYSSPEECVRAAFEKGLSEIAFTDHVWRTSEWVDSYVRAINELRDRYKEIKIFIGLEAKAVNLKGDVDAKPEDIEKVDFLMGAVHRRLPMESNSRYRDLATFDPEEVPVIERDIIAALAENPNVDVIAHPMRLYYKFYYQKKTKRTFPKCILQGILSLIKGNKKLVELNYDIPNCEVVLDEYLDSGVSFTLGSDAHHQEEVGDIPFWKIYQKCQEKLSY